jgi:hypothetical protein
MIASISFCPASAAVLPELGRSAFVRRAVLAYVESMSPTPSKGEPETAKPETAKPETVKAYNPAEWVRDGRMPDLKLAPYRFTELRYAKDGECLNPPAWPAFPGLNGIHNSRWREYLDKWKWPEPFPGPLEWVAMGQPAEPLPEHRRAATVEAVEPVKVEAVEPDTVPTSTGENPLPCGPVSASVLDDI